MPQRNHQSPAMVAYCEAHLPQFADGARLGYDVSGSVLAHVCQRIAAPFPRARILTASPDLPKQPYGVRICKRKSPSRTAIDASEAAERHLEELTSPPAPTVYTVAVIEMSPVVRIYAATRYTAVVVYVYLYEGGGCGERAIVIPAEVVP